MDIGNKIKEVRTKFGLAQEELAEKLNVSRQAIAKWEGGNGIPDTENLITISKLFGVSIDTLLDNESDIPLVVLHQDINLKEFGKSRLEQNINVINKYFDNTWEIYGLYYDNKLFSAEQVAKILTFGISELPTLISVAKETQVLAVKDNYKLLVTISKNSIDIKSLNSNINIKKFNVGNKTYHNLGVVKR